MTDCPNGDVRDLLPDLLHDRLAPDVRREVEAHVSGCDECRAELALLGAMRSTLRRGPAVDVAAIGAAIPPYRAPARRSWAGWRAAAAIVILAAGGTSVAVLRSSDGGDVARDTASAMVAARAGDSLAPTAEPVASRPAAATATPRELALGSSAVSDLDDRELSNLLNDLQTLEALPSADVENVAAVSPLGPTGTN
jgi:anti-sigma factor RsiW